MQVILLETLNKLGKAGEIVSVKDGYANNFLIPSKKAIIANKKNKDILTSKMSQIRDNNERKILEAKEIQSKLDGIELTIQMEANESGNLYGNVRPRQLHEIIKKDYSVTIDPGNIVLDNVKELGNHIITIRIYGEVIAKIQLRIQKK